MTHPLLQRQLSKLGLGEKILPKTEEEWVEHLVRVSRAYQDADQERYLLERSLRISSQEMKVRWAKLQEMEQRWESLVKCVPDLIMTVGIDGKILFLNRPIESHSQSRDIDQNISQIFTTDESKWLRSSLNDFFATGKLFNGEASVLTSDGKKRFFSIRTGQMTWANKDLTVILIATDITEKKQLEGTVEKERAVSFQASKMATLGEMAAGIAHEINNPLAIIKVFAGQLGELINEENFDRELIKDASKEIESTVERIAKVIKGLRTFARNGASDPFSQEKIGQIIEDTLSLCHQRSQEQSTPIEVDMPDPEIAIFCKAPLISQVVLNLINNAFDAVEDLPEKWIKVSVKGIQNNLEILVTDSGSGIPSAIQEKILEPFFTTKPLGKGTGLGLSISKGIIENHKGKLSLNADSKNTQFIVTLPIEQTD